MSPANQDAVSNNNIKITTMKKRKRKIDERGLTRFRCRKSRRRMPAKRSHLSVHPAGQVGQAGSSSTTCPTSAAACPHTPRSYCETQKKTNFVSTQLRTPVPDRSVGSLTPIRSDQKPIHRLGLGPDESNREKWCTQLTRCICVLARAC